MRRERFDPGSAAGTCRAALSAFVVAIGSAGCAATPSPPSSPAPVASASQRYPFVFIERDDNYADERSSSSFHLTPDGTVAIEHEMSDGGSGSTIKRCSGAIPPKEAESWVERVHRAATAPIPPRGPRREEAFERKIPYSYRVGYAASTTQTTYADPASPVVEIERLVERLSASTPCRQ